MDEANNVLTKVNLMIFRLRPNKKIIEKRDQSERSENIKNSKLLLEFEIQVIKLLASIFII